MSTHHDVSWDEVLYSTEEFQYFYNYYLFNICRNLGNMLRIDGKAISPGKKENPGGLRQITDKEEWLRDSEFSTY